MSFIARFQHSREEALTGNVLDLLVELGVAAGKDDDDELGVGLALHVCLLARETETAVDVALSIDALGLGVLDLDA